MRVNFKYLSRVKKVVGLTNIVAVDFNPPKMLKQGFESRRLGTFICSIPTEFLNEIYD